mmetsp:Transcript_22415/g.64373  ORF Transcript_22415/g.64373 Transcript_22415/m.64373 type:complete len:217 (+) Transcript_22415:250-900(+)
MQGARGEVLGEARDVRVGLVAAVVGLPRHCEGAEGEELTDPGDRRAELGVLRHAEGLLDLLVHLHLLVREEHVHVHLGAFARGQEAQGRRVHALHHGRLHAELLADLRRHPVAVLVALVAAEGDLRGGGEGHDVADLHQRAEDLRSVLQRFPRREAASDGLKGAVPPSVDHRDPVVRGPRQDELPLPADADALHQGRRQAAEAEEQQLVVAADTGL